ncbi:MAG TPA: ribosome biogenesis factor YjgA [Xanthomonadales bacterium]|nr:ribosome biogenesis factor YjgA [Xanthomonadales bacterium]
MTDEEFDEAPPERLPRDQRPSRSSLRRDALAVFDLAEALVAMPESQLAQVGLPDDLAALVVESRRITQHIARKRQLQYLAKHLRRNEDVLPAIRAVLDRDRLEKRADAAKLHRVEHWRDRLIDGGDEALGELLAEHPAADRQHLRQLARNAKAERIANKPPASARELFRALRELLDEREMGNRE